MDKKEIARILEEIAVFLELKGENPFKVRAYANAARTILSSNIDLGSTPNKEELARLKGIGQAIAEKIEELVSSGRMDYYEQLKAAIPAGLLEMLKVPGVGPKKVKVLYEKLGTSSLGELEYACNENRLLKLEGFGLKSQEKILSGIQYLKKHRGRFLYNFAFEAASHIFESIKNHPDIIRVSVGGSLRRHLETVKDIDILVSTKNSKPVMDYFTSMDDVEDVIAKGETKSSIRLHSGLPSDLRAVSDEQFPFALHYFTGSKAHNTAMRGRAKRLNLKLNEYGLFHDDTLIPCHDEEEIFKKLGLHYIPPELREDNGEIEAAEKGELPALVEEGDIRGTFHVHSVYSDGIATLEELAREGIKMGYRYLGISDHSQSASYAHGLKEETVREQLRAIDEINRTFEKIRFFKGTETDILADGNLDYSDEILAAFDFVVISVHSKFNMTEKEMTQRIIKAMANPFVTILAHPTGRLLLAREAYPVNLYEITEAAAQYGVIIELNASPHRFDLDWRFCRYAKEKGVKISINPDAHSLEGLHDTAYGVGIARKGWLGRQDIFNCLELSEVVDYLDGRKQKALLKAKLK